jgi:hypothetical protein
MRFCVALLLAGCSQSPNYACVSGTTRRFMLTEMTVPQQRSDYAIDLNGDGRPDNQLGNIVGALTGGGVNAQDYVDQAFAAGLQPTSVEVIANGTGGTALMEEDLPGHEEGVFCAWVRVTVFDSEPPPLMEVPAELSMTLAFADNVTVRVTAAQLHLKGLDGDQITGELHGAVRKDEFDAVVIPGVAHLMTRKIQGDPKSATSKQFAQLFDVGDGNGGSCRNPDGTTEPPNDGRVGVCEVLGNSITKNVTAPDVDLFDDADHFHPNKDNTQKDSISLGVQFTAQAVQ